MSPEQDILMASPETDSTIVLTPDLGLADNEVFYGQSLENKALTGWAGWYRDSAGSVYVICRDQDGYLVFLPNGRGNHAWANGYSWAAVKSAYGLNGVAAFQSRSNVRCR